MNFLRRLFGRYSDYHAHGPELLQYAGIVGIFAYPLFYLLRFAKTEAPFDDWPLRAIGVVLCVGLALKTWWPVRIRRHYIAYSYWVMLYCLPIFFVATSLINGGGTVAVANTMMAVFFLILLSDWRNTIVLLVAGVAFGAAIYAALVPEPEWPMDYIGRLPIAVLVVIGGSLFKFAEKRAEADKLRRTYSALAGSIAHEMRNPLSQLSFALESIERTLPAPTTSEDVQQVNAARLDELYRHLASGQLAVQRGLQVISLTLGEVRSNALDPSSFIFISAAAATCRAVDEYGYESVAQRARVQVRVQQDFSFRGDETVYLFILFNLIRNALYYFDTHPRARLVLTVDAGRISVRDSGPGMSEAALRHLFEPFSTSGKTGGTGLGLSYCRRAMRAFGGDIECNSKRGEFTEFTLSLPAVPPEQIEAEQQLRLEAASASLAGKHVLVVDDEPRLRQSTRRLLLSLGCVPNEAASGQQAIEMLRGIECDAMVLDLKMPDVDGYAVAMRLRGGEVPGCEHLPIVALTSEPAHIAFPKTRKVGMNGFVGKPGTPLALATALRLALQPAPRGLRPLEGRTVILAEDNAYSRSVMRANLQQWGVVVLEAWSGGAVLGQLETASEGGTGVDLVLMDLNMPGMDGLEATREIRARGTGWSRLPIIALTGHSDDATLGEAMEAGVTDYLVKPVELGVLLQQLLRYLGSAQHSSLPPVSGPAVPPPARPPAIEVPAAAAPDRLLNVSRLEQLRRIDMLDSLPQYLQQMHVLLERLSAAWAANDLAAGRDALHSLLGISGDAGAQALHAASLALYPALAERRWPLEDDWLEQLENLAQATEAAMRERYIRNPPG